MADIINEIDTIGDLLAPIGVDRFHKQDLPKVYAKNTIGIRWQGDGSESETGAHYRIDRIYQVIYFGKSEADCLQKVSKIQTIFNEKLKAKLRGSDGYITLGSFVFAKPFKTDTDGVFAVSGILPVTVRVLREVASVVPPKIGNVVTELTLTPPIQPSQATPKPGKPGSGSDEPEGNDEQATEEVSVITNPNYTCGKGEI